MAFSVGETLQAGKYRLDALLEERPWGMTFLATHQGVEQQVIIKTYQETDTVSGPSKTHLESYISFAKKLIRFHHPRLSRVINVFEEDQKACMVSEFIQGSLLSESIKQKPLEEAKALQLIQQVTQGLHGLHRHGLLHLNLRPSRIIQRASDQEVALIGLNSRFSGQPEERQLNPYLALEQNQSTGKVSLVSEIYGVASTLYALVTGQHPTPAAQRFEQPLRSPKDIRPNLSDSVEHAILRGMAIQASDRPQSMKEWLSLLPKASTTPETTKLQVPPAWEVKLPAFRDAGVKNPVTTVITNEANQEQASKVPNFKIAEPTNTKPEGISAPADQKNAESVHPELDSILDNLAASSSPEQTTKLQMTPAVNTPEQAKSQTPAEATVSPIPEVAEPLPIVEIKTPESTTLQVKSETTESSGQSSIEATSETHSQSKSDMLVTPAKKKQKSRFPKWTLLWCAVLAACGGLGAGLWFRMKLTQQFFTPSPTAEQSPLDQLKTLDSREEKFLPTRSSVIPEEKSEFAEEEYPQEPSLEFDTAPTPEEDYASESEPEYREEDRPLAPWNNRDRRLNDARAQENEDLLTNPDSADISNTESIDTFESELEPPEELTENFETAPDSQSWNEENLISDPLDENLTYDREFIDEPTTNTF